MIPRNPDVLLFFEKQDGKDRVLVAANVRNRSKRDASKSGMDIQVKICIAEQKRSWKQNWSLCPLSVSNLLSIDEMILVFKSIILKTIIEYETFPFYCLFSFASVRSPRPSNSLLLTVNLSLEFMEQADGVPAYRLDYKGKPVFNFRSFGLLTEEADLTRGFKQQTLNVLLLITTGILLWGEYQPGTEPL